MPTDDFPSTPLGATIRGEIVRQLAVDAERVVPPASLVDDLGVDSLLHMTMVVGLEQRFGILIPDAVAARFATVADVIEAVRGLAAAAAGQPGASS